MFEEPDNEETDSVYFRRRAEEELQSAKFAAVPEARKAHEEIAQVYERRARGLDS